jgi:predicted RNase H-like HicB family nuclease
MEYNHILTEYITSAMNSAEYDKLEDGTFFGKINQCKGVVAFAKTLHECEDELRSILEDWILLGLKLNHALPIISGIDLNLVPQNEPMETL